MTWICSYHSVIDHCWVGWFFHPKASRKAHHTRVYDIYEMIRGLIYAMPCIVFVCLLSFLRFSAMRFASLYRRERPLSLLSFFLSGLACLAGLL